MNTHWYKDLSVKYSSKLHLSNKNASNVIDPTGEWINNNIAIPYNETLTIDTLLLYITWL